MMPIPACVRQYLGRSQDSFKVLRRSGQSREVKSTSDTAHGFLGVGRATSPRGERMPEVSILPGGQGGAMTRLPAAPQCPGIPDFPEIQDLLASLGHRHIADFVARRPGRSFRILDGLWFAKKGGLSWAPVDQGWLTRMRTGVDHQEAGDRRTKSLAVLDSLIPAVRQDGLAVRRLALYQILRLVWGAPGYGTDVAAAEACVLGLGVVAEEAPVIARMVARAGRGLDLAAVEALQGAYQSRKLVQARGLAVRIAGHATDHALTRLLARVADASEEVDRLVSEGEKCEADGYTDGAVRHFLKVARLVADDPRIPGLLKRCAPPPVGSLAARAEREGVRLDWKPSATSEGVISHRVVRIRMGHGAEEICRTTALSVVDLGVPLGEQVTYTVRAVRDGQYESEPVSIGPRVFTPDVEDLALVSGNGLVRGTWARPSRADSVRVVRAVGRAPRDMTDGDEVLNDGLSFADQTIQIDTYYHYRVSAGYCAVDGSWVWSPGVTADVQVGRWPVPVTDYDVREKPRGSVSLRWQPPPFGEVQVLSLHRGSPVVQGLDLAASDVDGLGQRVAQSLVRPPADAEAVVPDLDGDVRLALVTVLGPRAIVGPVLAVAVEPRATSLSARRFGDEVAVRWVWPARVSELEVRWDGDGNGASPHAGGARKLTQAEYTRLGMRFPANGTQYVVQVAATREPSSADLVIRSGGAMAVVPAQPDIDYTVDQPSPWLRHRRKVTVAYHGYGQELPPDFVIVARSGRIVPLGPEDGVELARIPSARLKEDPAGIEAEFDVKDVGLPCRLRGFAVGAGAEAVRVRHPARRHLAVG